MKQIDLSANIPIDGSFVGTLGFFDGVHLGHRHLIEMVKEEAALLSLPSAVVTFPVHPRKVLQKDYQPELLCGFEEKIEQLETTGIDYSIILPFTTELSCLSAKEFMQQVLKNKIGLNTLFIGYDHRFGRNREDGIKEYTEYGKQLGMNVIEADELQVDGGNVSSTKIRKLLKNGEIEKANNLLSYNYTLSGKIVEGYRVGRTIGFPTANIKPREPYKLIPKLGVYAVLVHIKDAVYEGMLYVGKRSTLHEDPQTSIEVNIFDFNENLYNQSLTVEFIGFIRGDMKFETKDLLVNQIHKDRELVIERLKDISHR